MKKIFYIVILLFSCNQKETCDTFSKDWASGKLDKYMYENERNHLIYMQCLLDFMNDTMICVQYSGYTNPQAQSKFLLASGERNSSPGTKRYYDITYQIAALYSISALYYKDVEFCDYVRLYDDKGDVVNNNDTLQLNYILNKHINWIKEAKVKGLKEMRKNKNSPLYGTGYTWNMED